MTAANDLPGPAQIAPASSANELPTDDQQGRALTAIDERHPGQAQFDEGHSCGPRPGHRRRTTADRSLSRDATEPDHRKRRSPDNTTTAATAPPCRIGAVVDCLEIGYPYAHISCSGARAVTGGEHGGRLTLGGSWLLKRTLWSPPPDPGRAGTTVACQRPRGA